MIIMSIELFGLENIPIIDGSSDISKIIKEAIEAIEHINDPNYINKKRIMLHSLRHST